MPCALAHAWPKTRSIARDDRASRATPRDAATTRDGDANTDATDDDDATAHTGAAVHREGAFLAAFDARGVEACAIGRHGRSGRGVGRIETDAEARGARVVACGWREASARRGARARDGGGKWDVEGGRERRDERLGTSLVSVSADGEVYISRASATTRSDGEFEGTLEIERVVTLDDGERATCCASDDDEIVVGTDRGRVVFLCWEEGSEGRSATCARSERDGGATSVAWCRDTGTVVVRFDAGAVCALEIDAAGDVRRRNWFDAFPCPATCAAFHRGSRRLALGTADGEIRVYDDAMTSEAAKPRHVFGLSPWGFGVEDTGALAHASWSNDGRALAVGWRRRGVSVWSESGCLLMCTLHHGGGDSAVGTSSSPRATFTGDEEVPEMGACLAPPAWGVGDYALFVPVRSESGSKVLEYALAKSVSNSRVAPRSYDGGCDHDDASLLLGDDRIFIVASSATSTRVHARQEVCPSEYVQRQWPMCVAGMSPSGDRVAVGGVRGCVVFDTRGECWSQLGDVEEENSFEAIAFDWMQPAPPTSGRQRSVLQPVLAIVARLGRTRMFTKSIKLSYGISFYADGGKGDLLMTMPLPSEATGAYACGEFLLVSFSNGEIAVYEVEEMSSNVGAISAHHVREDAGQRRKTTLNAGGRVQGMCAVPPAAAPERAPSECVVLTEAGELFVVDLTDEYDQVKLFDDVAEFWVVGSANAPQEMMMQGDESSDFESDARDSLSVDGGCVFAYGAEGMRICYFPNGDLRQILINGATSCDVERAANNPELEFDRELYPMSVSLNMNRIIGVTQKFSFADAVDMPYFTIAPKSHTIVPYILRKLLSSGQHDAALRYARAARRQTPHFMHALEWLLFTALERSNREITSQTVLKQSIALLSELPNYLDVIVSVARKTDNTRWESLFKYAGKPSELCVKALKLKRIRIAACYILVVDKLEGETMGREIAVRVMRAALEAREYKLVEDLIKFLLQPADEAAKENQKPGIFKRVLEVIAPPPNSVIALGGRADRELALGEPEQLLLKSHVDSLGRERDVAAMGAFMSETSFDGVAYLKHETDENGEAYISDFAGSIELAARRLREGKLRRAASSQSSRTESLFLVDPTRAVGSKVESDATYVTSLLATAREAGCTDWSLLLATLLGRADVLNEFFTNEPALREPWMNIAKRVATNTSDATLKNHLTALVSDI